MLLIINSTADPPVSFIYKNSFIISLGDILENLKKISVSSISKSSISGTSSSRDFTIFTFQRERERKRKRDIEILRERLRERLREK